MGKRPLLTIGLCIALVVALLFATFFGGIHWIERQRIADATPAFQRLQLLGVSIFSSPVPFNRYCLYVVEVKPETKLSDDNVEELLALNHLPVRNLLEVSIRSPSVTDASLPTLSKLNTVDTLDLSRSAITREGCEELKRQLPDCEIYCTE